MFGLGNNDEEQRTWNFILFKMPLTDKELEEAGPTIIITTIAAIIIIIIFILCI